MRFIEARGFVEHNLAYEILQDSKSGIVGFAVGRKHGRAITEGGKSDFCITAFVIKKLSPDALAVAGIFDAYIRCKEAAGQISISFERDDFRVVEAGSNVQLQAYSGSSHSSPASANTQKWFVGLRPGIGIANPEGNYPTTLGGGTIAFFAKRENDSGVFLVSCNHVIARERTTGGTGNVPAEPVVQPATMDMSGRDITVYLLPRDLAGPFGVATLFAFVDVHTHLPGTATPPSNTVDAAIAKISTAREPNTLLARLPYGGRLVGTHDFIWDEASETVIGSSEVFKCGRTTGYTEGVVTHIRGVASLDFNGQKARFSGQLVIEPTADNTGRFSDAGDSGSPVVTDEHKVAGMVFAGTLRQSWATPVQVILDELALALDNSGSPVGTLSLVI